MLHLPEVLLYHYLNQILNDDFEMLFIDMLHEDLFGKWSHMRLDIMFKDDIQMKYHEVILDLVL